MTDLIEFYKNHEPNSEGLYLKDIWSFNDWELENTHHFIQWMFPIELASHHNDSAPVISTKEIKSVGKNDEVKQNILTSLNVIENFWGFNVDHKEDNFKRPRGFQNYMQKNWLTAYNHNFIRITRVLHSLVVFGLEKEAYELFEYLEDKVYPANKHLIGAEAFNEWKMALNKKIIEKKAA